MKPVRRSRRDSIKEQLEYILDSLFVSKDDGANIDPLLDTAYPLGTAKGKDKALRYWTIADFRELAQTAFRNAADVVAAAAALEKTIDRVIKLMEAQRADSFGDLNNPDDPDDNDGDDE